MDYGKPEFNVSIDPAKPGADLTVCSVVTRRPDGSYVALDQITLQPGEWPVAWNGIPLRYSR